MQSSIRLGRLFGVEIGLHYSWILIAALITFSLGAQFQSSHPEWGGTVIWGLAILTAVLFFASIVVHELSHALVALRAHLPVRSITLFALGGVAQIEKEAGDAKTEFWMGFVGPLTSLAIGFVSLGLALLLGWDMGTLPVSPLQSMVVWLGFINIALAVFNMIPGFPLDGGRVLRAAIWWRTGDASRATRTAARVGQAVAFGFIILGFLRFFGGAGFSGLWLAFIGWFLLEAARTSYSQVRVTEELRGVRVGDIMARDCPTIDRELSLQQFVDEYLLRTGRRCYMVAENGEVIGLVTPNEIKSTERARWAETRVGQVMRPLDVLRTVAPDTPVTEVLEAMGRDDINQLPVVQNDRLQGVITRGHVLRFLQARAELKI